VDDGGVFDRHAEIARSGTEFVLRVVPPAIISVNAEPIQQRTLQSGDIIQVGSAQLRFGLSPTRHLSLRMREVLTWVGLALLCLAQVALIYLLG
jgi:hypothetical protein